MLRQPAALQLLADSTPASRSAASTVPCHSCTLPTQHEQSLPLLKPCPARLPPAIGCLIGSYPAAFRAPGTRGEATRSPKVPLLPPPDRPRSRVAALPSVTIPATSYLWTHPADHLPRSFPPGGAPAARPRCSAGWCHGMCRPPLLSRRCRWGGRGPRGPTCPRQLHRAGRPGPPWGAKAPVGRAQGRSSAARMKAPGSCSSAVGDGFARAGGQWPATWKLAVAWQATCRGGGRSRGACAGPLRLPAQQGRSAGVVLGKIVGAQWLRGWVGGRR